MTRQFSWSHISPAPGKPIGMELPLIGREPIIVLGLHDTTCDKQVCETRSEVEELRFDQLAPSQWKPYSGPGAMWYRTRDGAYTVRAKDGYVHPTSSMVNLPVGVQVKPNPWEGINYSAEVQRRLQQLEKLRQELSYEEGDPAVTCDHRPVDNGFRRAWCKCGSHAFLMIDGRWSRE